MVKCIKKPVDIKMRGLPVGTCSKVRTKWRLAAWFWWKMSICRQSNFDSSSSGSWEKYNFVNAACKSTRTQFFFKLKNNPKIHFFHIYKYKFWKKIFNINTLPTEIFKFNIPWKKLLSILSKKILQNFYWSLPWMCIKGTYTNYLLSTFSKTFPWNLLMIIDLNVHKACM